MSSQAGKQRRPKDEGLTAQGNILYIRPLPKGWPAASERPSRPGLWESKGLDPITGKRKSYYASNAYDASRQAAASLGYDVEQNEAQTDLTLHSFYCEVYWPGLKARSYNWREQVRWAYDHYIGPKWGGTDLRAITKRDAQNWFNSLIGTVANSSLGKIKIVFSAIYNAAMDETEDDQSQAVTRNPITRIKLPAVIEPDKIALTASQLHRLIIHAQGREIAPIILASLSLAKGETCAVQYDRIRGGILDVNQQIQYEKGKGFFVTSILKTPQRKRKIPLPENVIKRLADAKGKSDIFVCSDSVGGFLTPKNFDRELAAACKRAQIPSISPHELRHTFISILENELEIPTTIVSRLAGKAKKGINRDYSHSTMQQMRRAMDAYWQLILSADPEECLHDCTTDLSYKTAN